jgi:hypothetical protein
VETRLKRRAATCAHKVVGNKSNAGILARKARLGDFKIRKQTHPPCVVGNPSSPFALYWRSRPGLLCYLQQFVGQDLAHIRSRPHTAVHVTFGLELLENVDDRSARKFVLAG